MPCEVNWLLTTQLRDTQEVEIGGWKFWRGNIEGIPVVISVTGKGAANTGAATALALSHFRCRGVINQGTAGGHDPQLNVGDLIIGEYAINIAAFKTSHRARGEGSNTLDWLPMDLLASEGSAGEDANALKMRSFPSDPDLIEAAKRASLTFDTPGKIIGGGIASSEVWNLELDRIHSFHSQFGSRCEEMETASAAQIAARVSVPFLGVRVITNNITTGEKYDISVALRCQRFVAEIAKNLGNDHGVLS